ncbi:MAG: AbrB/MazE/SpoVT family DNA-binding domain-containing protein [Thermomicrobiales bacterium]
MIEAKVRKQGNSFVVTIPKEAMERYQLEEGDEVALTVTKLEKRAVLRPELQEIVSRLIREHKDALEYLADR